MNLLDPVGKKYFLTLGMFGHVYTSLVDLMFTLKVFIFITRWLGKWPSEETNPQIFPTPATQLTLMFFHTLLRLLFISNYFVKFRRQ